MREKRRQKLYEIIFESHTRAGKAFDLVLIVAILASVLTVMLDSVEAVRIAYGAELLAAEWIFSSLFTVEYVLRLYCSPSPKRYARSFFGLIDLLAVAPTYFSFFFPQTRFLLTVRVLRLLRVFRVFKLAHFVGHQNVLKRALWASRYKITVFLLSVLTIVIVVGSVMYVVEGAHSGFSSIPVSIYWAIVTLTTVGYGDIAPQTPLGQALAAFLMITGYGIIAVPTGIVTIELDRASRAGTTCTECGVGVLQEGMNYCGNCGAAVAPEA